MNFTPLHVYSGYSFQKSGIHNEAYCAYAKALGYSSLAVTDFETLSGAPNFVHEAKSKGLKPIVGLDIVVDNLLTTFIVQNEEGYVHLLDFLIKKQKGELSFAYIRENSDGLFVIISTENIALKKAYLENKESFAKKFSRVSRGIKSFYIGIDMIDKGFAREMRDFAFSHGYSTVAFPHVKYLKKEDAIILRMVEAIETKEVLKEKKESGNEYLPSLEEVTKLYEENEIKTTNDIANAISFELIKPRGRLLKFKCEGNMSSKDYLRKLAFDGLKAKGHEGKEYIDRLNYELGVIDKMGFNDYFLIVQDYINFARKSDIAVGPGRGSASGSLVAHCIGITVPDPLEYGLLFERFLNPSRQTMPDIDVDFSDVDRERVVQYIADKYGHDHVAKITAIQKIGAKQSLHDVGRIFGYDKHDIDLFTNIIKDEKFDKLSLREIYKKSKDFRDLVNDDKYYLEIVSLASKIESLPRQASLHAVGIVLNAEPLDKMIPITLDQDGYIEQFEKDYIEEQGFLKMDILAIRNLTIIDDCLARIKARGINLNRDEIPYKDKEAIKLIAEGKTIGIFQLDTVAFRVALKTFKPDSFEDVVALLALNRPGPKANIPVYAKRKAGKEKITYLHPNLKDILSLTYGVLVYQEQVMQLASKMAGFSLAEADILRRAISKKDSSKLVGLKNSFIKGSIKNGYKQADAERVFNAIYKFGDYGFNRSHSVVYAIFSCRMAYLKAHYPEEFYAAILSNAGTEEFNNTIAEMKAANIKVKNPDINTSDLSYKLSNKDILFPLTAIRGINVSTAISIMKERENKPFEDIFDFVLRMSRYKLASQQVINLIDAGAFDKIEPSRNSLRNNVAAAYSFAAVFATPDGEESILSPNMFAKPSFIRVEDDPLDNLNREFNVLNLMVSGSPLGLVKDKIKKLKAIPISEIASSKGNIKVVAVLKSFRRTKTKNNTDMAFITIYDESSEMEAAIFEEALKVSSSLRRNKIVLIEGYYNFTRGSLNVNKLTNLEDIKDE